MKLVIVFCVVIACVVAQKVCTKEELAIYKKWQKDFNKPILDKKTESKKCLQLLKAIKMMEKSNADPKNHRSRLNEMSDLTEEEFRNRY